MSIPLGVREFLAHMESAAASDLYLHEGRAPAARIHGVVRTLAQPVTDRAALEALLDAVLQPAARARFDATGDADAGCTFEGRRFRLSLARQQGLLAVVARAVPSGALSFERLGLPEDVRGFAEPLRGLVLVTGATGSGKSTTLAALLHHINSTRRAHIVTIEDPIEFVHADVLARVTQREVGGDTASYGAALRHVLRQSPDVILIGELRDPETMRVALTAALTGHLVLTTMHTTDASRTLQRLLASFPEDERAQVAMDLSLSLVGVVSQRLLPNIDGTGRVVAVELLANTPAVARLLREQRVEELQELMRGSRMPGIMTFTAVLLRLYQAGRIGYEVGLAHASDPEEFALGVRGMSTGVAAFRGGEAGRTGALDLPAILAIATEQGASDVHLAAGRPCMLRVRGELTPLDGRELSDGDLRALLYGLLTTRQRAQYELEREIDFAIAMDDGRRYRVNAYFQKGKMAASLRAIPSRVPEAATLRLPEALLRLGARPQGLLLVVGPTGAGKSTTLACLVDRINRTRACRILTIEDPVEYAHEGLMATIDQREVHADTHSFAAALKYILRQDPDVILVGEMRDFETVGAALTAAETGHLVLATLHANDAAQAMDRIVDVFPAHAQAQARSQLSAALLGVISQRLLPTKDGAGRTPVFEVMIATTAIRTLIRDNKTHQCAVIMEASRRDGMVTMDSALKEAYEQGRVTYESASRHLTNPRTIPAPDAPKG